MTKNITITTGHEWLGFRNGYVVAVYATRWLAEARLSSRNVDSIAPVAQGARTPADVVGDVIGVVTPS